MSVADASLLHHIQALEECLIRRSKPQFTSLLSVASVGDARLMDRQPTFSKITAGNLIDQTTEDMNYTKDTRTGVKEELTLIC